MHRPQESLMTHVLGLEIISEHHRLLQCPCAFVQVQSSQHGGLDPSKGSSNTESHPFTYALMH